MIGGYGVLRGRVDRWVREDGEATPHLQIRVLEDSGQPWRIAVNVQSNTGSNVAFWVVDPLVGHPHAGVRPVGGDPVGVHELLGMGVRHGGEGQHHNHARECTALRCWVLGAGCCVLGAGCWVLGARM